MHILEEEKENIPAHSSVLSDHRHDTEVSFSAKKSGCEHSAEPLGCDLPGVHVRSIQSCPGGKSYLNV